MPFIDVKTSLPLSEGQKNSIKTRLGGAVSLLRKSERYLMVGIADGYALWMGGEKLDAGAFVAVSLFGKVSPSDCGRMTGEICRILSEEAGIPSEYVYVTYQGIADWGWNGSNF